MPLRRPFPATEMPGWITTSTLFILAAPARVGGLILGFAKRTEEVFLCTHRHVLLPGGPSMKSVQALDARLPDFAGCSISSNYDSSTRALYSSGWCADYPGDNDWEFAATKAVASRLRISTGGIAPVDAAGQGRC